MNEPQPQSGGRELGSGLQTVNDSMLDGLGKLAEYFGFNRVMGQLYGALLLSPEPMSLDDLESFLLKSKASVSTNLRTLERMGVVREVWVRGDRRKFYEAETDFWKIVVNVLSSRELRDLEQALRTLQENTEQLRQSMPAMSEEDAKIAELYLSRLDRLEHFFRFAQLILTSVLQRAVAGKFDVSEVSRIIIE